jgi:hypothetical protein
VYPSSSDYPFLHHQISSWIGKRAGRRGPSVEFWKIRRRFALNSASDWNGTPSSRAFSLVTDSERFKATEARSAEAPDAMSALSRAASLSDHTFFLGTTSCSHASRAGSRTPETFCWFPSAGVRPTVAALSPCARHVRRSAIRPGGASLLRAELRRWERRGRFLPERSPCLPSCDHPVWSWRYLSGRIGYNNILCERKDGFNDRNPGKDGKGLEPWWLAGT